MKDRLSFNLLAITVCKLPSFSDLKVNESELIDDR